MGSHRAQRARALLALFARRITQRYLAAEAASLKALAESAA
jgi:hypothetical protein